MGKITEANTKANRKLKKMFYDKGITSCELRLSGCMGGYFLSYAHRHKRLWYRGQLELLSDYNQVLLACQSCHDKIEDNKDLTESEFKRLRG